MADVRVVRDPNSHPVEQDLPFDDAFRPLDACHRVLRQLGSPAAEQLGALLEELRELPSVDQSEYNEIPGFLPAVESIAPDFVGRSEELQQLDGWLKDSETRRLALVGEGGLGKSALAYRFAQLVKHDPSAPV